MMGMIRRGYVTGLFLGALWMVVVAVTVSVAVAFATGGCCSAGHPCCAVFSGRLPGLSPCRACGAGCWRRHRLARFCF